MEYHEAADVLFGLRRFRPDPGTDATAALLAHLDHPHEVFDCIQIAGSNGKGSTARMVATILETAGYRVGLYTSPHLETVRERVQVNGRDIQKHRIVEYIETIYPYLTDRAAAGESPTFFETVTGLAFWQFAREDVDIAVLEVGIGGRYDATSVVDPVASAVTNVTLEHTDVLGDTIEEIARDKATVATDDTPLVTAATDDALAAIRGAVDSIHRVGADPAAATTVEYRGREDTLEAKVTVAGRGWSVTTTLSMGGAFQAANAGVAAVLARQVRSVDEQTIATGLRRTTWPGRVEVMDTDPLVVIDGAHNPGACEALAAAIEEFDYDDLHLVFGAMYDKDLTGMVRALPAAETVYACEATVDRAADAAVIARVFEQVDADISTVPAVEDAVATGIERATPSDCILVCGSLAVVAEARRRWTRTPIPRHLTAAADTATHLATADVPRSRHPALTDDIQQCVIHLPAATPRVYDLRDAARAVGLTAAASGLAGVDREPVPVVLAGATADLDRLADHLTTRDGGLAPYGKAIRSVLDGPPRTHRHADGWASGTGVMGIVNVTPDSFHDGGAYDTAETAARRARELADAGADIVDIGGESTRPGADPISADTERDRVLPVVDRLTDLDIPISVDTRRAAVADAVLDAGADIINDVSGLSDPAMRFTVADHDATLVLMHSLETPVDPEHTPTYDDVVTQVITDLVEPLHRARQAGLDPSQLIVDPGLGFGKPPAASFTLLDRLPELRALGCPIMVGHSHKSMFEAAGFGADERTHPTVAATTIAAERGADLVRVHDVEPNLAAIETVAATRGN